MQAMSEELRLPVVQIGDSENQGRVERGFWPKLVRVAARIPFAAELLSAYYCTKDPATPGFAKATLMAALAYFVLPADLIPDILAGIGFPMMARFF